jgi:hypothetical protein
MLINPPLGMFLVTPSARAGALVAPSAVTTADTKTSTSGRAHSLVCFILANLPPSANLPNRQVWDLRIAP